MGKVFTKDTLKLSLVIFVVAVISIMFYSWICYGATIDIFERFRGINCARALLVNPPYRYIISFLVYGVTLSIIISILIKKIQESKNNLKKTMTFLVPLLLIFFILSYWGISDCMECGNKLSDALGPKPYEDQYNCNSKEDCIYGIGTPVKKIRGRKIESPTECINKKNLTKEWNKTPFWIKGEKSKRFVECKCIEGKCEATYEEIDLERYKENKKYCEGDFDCECIQFCGCYNFYWGWRTMFENKDFEGCNFNKQEGEFDCDYFNCECENNTCISIPD